MNALSYGTVHALCYITARCHMRWACHKQHKGSMLTMFHPGIKGKDAREEAVKLIQQLDQDSDGHIGY